MRRCLPIVLLWLSAGHAAYSQSQACPVNIDWSLGNLTHWQAYTGNNAGGDGPSAIKKVYDSLVAAPGGTEGGTTIYEYQLSDSPAIRVISQSSKDLFGNFPTIPTVNGYQYTHTVKIGSISTDDDLPRGDTGGFIRGLSYSFQLPPGPATLPYTLTYVYALVMETGYHPNNQQPLFAITLAVDGNAVGCASPKHFLPTNPDGSLDTPAARSQGFFESEINPPNIWAKNWTEVSIDLAQYRGHQVSLTFEADNCVPGAHFSYGYIGVRNNCSVGVAAPVITGDTVVCPGAELQYSAPYLDGGSYQWQAPPGWSVLGSSTGLPFSVQAGNNPGPIVLNVQYSCDNLQSTLNVKTTTPTVAGAISGGTEICVGTTPVTLTSSGNVGSVLEWLTTTDGVHYTAVSDTTAVYTSNDLTATTSYRVVVQNGSGCAIDTSAAVTVIVDSASGGGQLSPVGLQLCAGQNQHILLQLSGQRGNVVNWQTSPDSLNWTGISPADTLTVYNLSGLTALTFFRAVVQDGVCPADISKALEVNYVSTAFPRASIDPADTVLCYGAPASLTAVISLGTNYSWTNAGTLQGEGNGQVGAPPDVLQAVARPPATTDYVLSVENAGCPNLLLDTFHVQVLAKIVVNAGDDTSVVVGEPLPLHVASSDTTTPGGDSFVWAPATGLSDANISDPVARYDQQDTIHYIVTAMAGDGCTGTGTLLVKVYGTGAGIFVPGAFTPGGMSNSIFRPVTVGIASLSYFRVYNRWGQLVYGTTALGEGWDGLIGGHLAETGVYVWMVQGTAYTGQVITHQGTVMLIR